MAGKGSHTEERGARDDISSPSARPSPWRMAFSARLFFGLIPKSMVSTYHMVPTRSSMHGFLELLSSIRVNKFREVLPEHSRIKNLWMVQDGMVWYVLNLADARCRIRSESKTTSNTKHITSEVTHMVLLTAIFQQ